MKLRNKLSIITASALLLFAGTGFAAWAFTNTVNPDEPVTVNGEVTCSIEAKNLKVYNGENEIDTLYVIFDAPTTAEGSRKSGEGIFYSSTADGANKITSLTLKGEITHNEEDLHYGDDVKVEFTKTEVDQLASSGYVTFTSGSLANDVQDVVVGTNLYEATYTLPTYSYVAAELPENVAEVDAMQTALTGKTLTLNFAFGIQA